MDAGSLLPLRLLQHDELADVGLHEEQEVEQDRGQQRGKHGPNLGIQTFLYFESWYLYCMSRK